MTPGPSRRAAVIAGLATPLVTACGVGEAIFSDGKPKTSTVTTPPPTSARLATPTPPPGAPTRASVIEEFGSTKPRYWGLDAPGVTPRFDGTKGPGKDAVCLTFDACGGHLVKYDHALIDLLRKYSIPATLFINMTWAQHNTAVFKELLSDPLFEIANHGKRHLPLSVSGRSAYKIPGTKNVGEVYDEIVEPTDYFIEQFGHHPKFMRSGTAYADEVAAAVAKKIGQELVGFSLNGDAGATFPAKVVTREVLKTKPGDIVISHMNRPTSGTHAGYTEALPQLIDRGLNFRKLSEVI